MNSDVKELLDHFIRVVLDSDGLPHEFVVADLKRMLALAKPGEEVEIIEYYRAAFSGRALCFMLHYLARAGLKEMKPYMEDFLNGNDEHDVFWAAVGLAHLGEQRGFDALRLFAEGSHPLSHHIEPFDDVLEELEEIEDERATEMIRLFEEGKFG